MAKNVYVGVSNVAHKVKKVYVGVSNVARKVKKIYVGVSNVARLVFTSELKVEKITNSLNSLSYGVDRLAGVTTTYVLSRVSHTVATFAGGCTRNTGTHRDDVRRYNESLTGSQVLQLTAARDQLTAASVGGCALFAGGMDNSNYYDIVDVFLYGATRQTALALSSSRVRFAGASVGDYAIFTGGYTGTTFVSTAEAFDESLTKSSITNRSSANDQLAGASVGEDYAIFAGGVFSSSQTVDAYNKSLTKSTPTNISVGRDQLAGASVGDYAIFAGGRASTVNPNTVSDVVDAYNASLVRSTPTALSVARTLLCGASIGKDYALFAGGISYTSTGNTVYNVVDAYDAALTRTTPTVLDSARSEFAGASVGSSYALFAGGWVNSNDSLKTVEGYRT